MKLFDKNTALGKSTRTLLQAVVGWAVVLLTTPGLKEWLTNQAGWVLPILPLAVAAATFIQNYIDSEVPNY